jgi:pimeloyl-ACP methyl ester carboxylesterase
MKGFVLEKLDSMIRYIDMPGQDSPIVFIHGLGLASSSHYPATVSQPHVASHRRILIDLLGHGYSDAPPSFSYSLTDHAETVAALLDDLDLKACALFGHSMGGAVAITLAAIRPDLVSRLILAEPNLDRGGGFISKFIAGYSEDEFVTTGHQALLARVGQLGFQTSVGSFRVCDSRGLYRSGVELVNATTPTMRERLYGMDIPRAVLVGERSHPEKDLEELPPHGVEVHVILNATHDMMIDNPSGVAAAITAALAAGLLQRP